jgi:hypothetical protein
MIFILYFVIFESLYFLLLSYIIKMKTTYAAFLFLIIISVVIYSCKDDVVDTTPAPVCDQKCKDDYTAWALADIFITIWNTNIAGRYQVGQTVTIDTNIYGPNGSSIRITGTVEINTAEYSILDLNYRMDAWKRETYAYSLLFTEGTVNIFGEMTSTTKNLRYRCNDIKFYGEVALNQAQSVAVFEQGCGIDFYETINTRSGTICNRQFP